MFWSILRNSLCFFLQLSINELSFSLVLMVISPCYTLKLGIIAAWKIWCTKSPQDTKTTFKSLNLESFHKLWFMDHILLYNPFYLFFMKSRGLKCGVHANSYLLRKSFEYMDRMFKVLLRAIHSLWITQFETIHWQIQCKEGKRKEIFSSHACNRRVNLLSRYGTWPPSFRFFSSPKALITLPRASNPLLIWIPWSCTPLENNLAFYQKRK